MNEGIRSRRWGKRALQLVVVVAAAGGAAYYFLGTGAEGGPVEYRFGSVERGTITNAVSSTGKVTAVGEVKIASLVAGQVIEVLVDYNTPVAPGQVLARLDPESFQSRVAQAEADLAIARASLTSNRAALERSQSDLRNGEASMQSLQAQLVNARLSLEQAERDANLQKELFARNVVSPKALDDANTKFEQAKANFDQVQANIAGSRATQEGRRAALAQSQASISTAEAQVKQREALLASAKIDLERTVIKAPSNGTVIDRTAEVGTTIQNNSNVALFTVAQDLRNMQLEVSVDEADIGKILAGMQIRFGVDAFPGREFQAVVRQVRLAPKTVQNVVTYTVIAQAPNPDLSLLPGMTATARVIVEERTNALRIPNSALRYTPSGFQAPAATAPGGTAAVVQVAAGGTGPANVQVTPQGANQGGGNAAVRNGGNAQAAQGGAGGQGGQGRQGGAQGAQGGGQAGAQAGAGGQGGGLTAQLAALNLTAAQQQQVQQALATARDQAVAAGGTQQEVLQRTAQAQRAAVLGVLTPEQRARFEGAAAAAGNTGGAAGGGPAARAEGGGQQLAQAAGGGQNFATAGGARNNASRARAARVFVLGPSGKPEPVNVMIGITDGGFTEMVAGDLPPGTRVITGSNEPAAPTQTNTPNPFGFPGGGGGGGPAPQIVVKGG